MMTTALLLLAAAFSHEVAGDVLYRKDRYAWGGLQRLNRDDNKKRLPTDCEKLCLANKWCDAINIGRKGSYRNKCEIYSGLVRDNMEFYNGRDKDGVRAWIPKKLQQDDYWTAVYRGRGDLHDVSGTIGHEVPMWTADNSYLYSNYKVDNSDYVDWDSNDKMYWRSDAEVVSDVLGAPIVGVALLGVVAGAVIAVYACTRKRVIVGETGALL